MTFVLSLTSAPCLLQLKQRQYTIMAERSEGHGRRNQNYQDRALEDVLDGMLSEWEELYDCEKNGSLSDRFKKLMRSAREQTGKKCVVLVDEYDKPLLEVLENDTLESRPGAPALSDGVSYYHGLRQGRTALYPWLPQ